MYFLDVFYRYYTKARDVLHQYQHMSSFRDIQQDCEVIVKDLRDCLKDHFRDPKVKISHIGMSNCNSKFVRFCNENEMDVHFRTAYLYRVFHCYSSRLPNNSQSVLICCYNWKNLRMNYVTSIWHSKFNCNTLITRPQILYYWNSGAKISIH